MNKTSRNNKTQAMARERTDWAEYRTVLVHERMFAGRTRTGLISIGMGLTVLTVLRAMEPSWVPKAVASAFIFLALLIFYGAWRKSCQAIERLSAHSVEAVPRCRFSLIAAMMSFASLGVAMVVWLT